MFVDEKKLIISGGDGGDGSVHWHREKFIPNGGPDGGNGGCGGDAYIEAIRDIRALERYRENEIISATNGNPGASKLMGGKNGKDITIFVPIGSIITNEETLEKFELLKEGDRELIATGGVGGFGNAHFKSSVNTTPKTGTPGEKAQSYTFKIELNIIADIGIIGLPNAGKSTLLNTVTNTKANVSNYPFTTLEPNIGMFHKYVLADIPGLIENASTGKGLGHKFLRHIKRTRMLVHLISCENEDPLKAYNTIRKELSLFDKELTTKKELIILSKTDTRTEEEYKRMLKLMPKGTVPLTVLGDDEINNFKKELSKHLADI